MHYKALIASAILACSTIAAADDTMLRSAIAGDHRTKAYIERDVWRQPMKTLKLFDIQPQHTVMEVWPGSGWYTEILAPYLKDKGLLIAAHYDREDTQAAYRPGARQRFEEKLASRVDTYGKVKIGSLVFNEKTGTLVKAAVKASSVDRIVTFRNAHGWFSNGVTDAAFKHFFAALKPGGKLGIVQHMADEGQNWRTKNIGYIGRNYVIDKALEAGFELEAEGFFNLNPLDNKRYQGGVWALPPTYNNLKTTAEKAPYSAIGESERMTLVFIKPQGHMNN